MVDNINPVTPLVGGVPLGADNPTPISMVPYAAVGDGRKVVAAAGTREALAASTACRFVVVTAETDNTGIVVVGGATVVASLATRRGTPLNAGDTITIEVGNLASIYLDVTVSGDGVTYTYGT